MSQADVNDLYNDYLREVRSIARTQRIAVETVCNNMTFNDWLTGETLEPTQQQLHVTHVSTTGDDTHYKLSDGTKVTIRYEHHFGESHPVGGCSIAQQTAIFRYLDNIVSSGGK